MTEFLQLSEPLSVAQRVAIGIGTTVIVLALLIFVTSLLTGLRRAMALWALVIVGGVLFFWFRPVGLDRIASNPNPAADYAGAVARFEVHRDRAPEPISPLCEPQLFTHGDADRPAVVLLHGVSSCPRAYVDFAPYLFERGLNVATLRMPQNGFADRSTDALDRLTAEDLAAFGDEAADIAEGLGTTSIVLGISAGGTVAGWVAQNRDVDRAVLVAPFFGLGGVGPRANNLIMRVLTLVPPFSIWKDSRLREHYEGNMPHAYTRQSTRGSGEIMRLGYAIFDEAGKAPPKAESIVVVTNEADTAVSNSTIDAFVRLWRSHGADVETKVFPASEGLGHEIIDPLEPGASTELTYPILADLIEGRF